MWSPTWVTVRCFHTTVKNAYSDQFLQATHEHTKSFLSSSSLRRYCASNKITINISQFLQSSWTFTLLHAKYMNTSQFKWAPGHFLGVDPLMYNVTQLERGCFLKNLGKPNSSKYADGTKNKREREREREIDAFDRHMYHLRFEPDVRSIKKKLIRNYCPCY